MSRRAALGLQLAMVDPDTWELLNHRIRVLGGFKQAPLAHL